MAEVLQEVTIRLVQELVGSEPKVVVEAKNVPHPLAGIDLMAAGIHECLQLHERMVQEAMAREARIDPIHVSALKPRGMN